MRTKTVDFAKLGITGLEITSIKVRTTNGDDLLAAAARCVPPSGQSIDGNIFGLMMRQQMIAQAIVELDGKPVNGPCVAFTRMERVTQEYVGEIYDSLNGLEESKRKDFQKALTTIES